MGDDDELIPRTLEIYSNLIQKYPLLDVYHAWTEIIDENSNFVSLQAPRIEYESVYSLIWNRWDNRKRQFIGDFLFKVDTLKRNHGFYKLPLAWASDDISACMAAENNGIANTSEIAFRYRVNRQTISKNGNVELKLKAIRLEERWYTEFLQKEPTNDTDKKFHTLIKNNFNTHFEKKKGYNISYDLKSNKLRVIHWFLKRHKYNYGIKAILYALYLSCH